MIDSEELAEARAIAEAVGPCDCDSFACSNMLAAAQERFSDRFGQKTVLGLLNEIERLNSTEKYLREKARDEHLARIESDEEDATEYLAIEQELAEANAEIGRLRESEPKPKKAEDLAAAWKCVHDAWQEMHDFNYWNEYGEEDDEISDRKVLLGSNINAALTVAQELQKEYEANIS